MINFIGFSKFKFSDDYEVDNHLKNNHCTEHNSKDLDLPHIDYTRQRQSTLEKILLRQEEAKARRELRQKELESRRILEATNRQIKAQILYKAKQVYIFDHTFLYYNYLL